MKKFLALVLALLMALSCFSFAGAETICQHEKAKDAVGTLVTAATCTTPAVYKYTCTRCGKEFNLEEGPVSNHQGGTATKVTSADCTHGTITDYDKCSVCGKPYSVEANDKLNHDFEDVKDSAVAATCTTPATKQMKCKNCGETKTVETAPATGHKFSDKFANDIPATCSKPGKKGSAYYCENGCGAYDTTREYDLVEIPALTHTADDGDVYDAFIDHFFTVVEGELTVDTAKLTDIKEGTRTVKAAGISTVYGTEKGFEVEYKAVTCTEDGHLTVTCLDCGKSWTATKKAVGHIYNLAIVHFVNGTGKADQKEFTLEENKTLKQQWEEFVASITDPALAKMVEDCTDTLNVEYKCVNCDAKINGEGFACTHDFDNGRVIEYKQQKYGEQKVSTYTNLSDIVKCQPYTIVKQCKYCTVTTEVAGMVEKHSMQQYDELTEEQKKAQVFEEPTCTKEGSVLLKCENDGCTYTVLQSIAKDDHVKDPEKTEIVPATCTKAGTRTFTCKDCGYQWTEVIPAIGHDYEVVKDEPGTCTTAAVKVETCKYCGDTKTTTGSLGHTLKDRADIKVQYNGELLLQDGAKEYTVLGVKWTDCSKEGRVQYVCGKCCKLITIENKAGTAHEWGLVKNDTAYAGTKYEGYTDKGYKVKDIVKVDEISHKVVIEGLYACKNCEQTETREFTVEVKHVRDTAVAPIIETGKEPTCTKAGEGYYKCADCGKLYKAAVDAKLHNYVTTWDGEKWVYTCSLCGDVKTLDYTAEKYVIDLKDVTFGARTEGYASVKLENSLTPAGIFGTRYAYIRWTWTGANNEKWVAEDTRAIVDGKIDMKGMKAPVGTTLSEVLVIVTGEKSADSMQLGDFSNYGYVIK